MKEKLGGLGAMTRSRFEAMERAGGPTVRREIELLMDDWQQAVVDWFPDETQG